MRVPALTLSLPAALIGLGMSAPARSQALTSYMEAVRIAGVSTGWQRVTLTNSYADPIIACTRVLSSASDDEAAVRIRNRSANGFDLRLQGWTATGTPGPSAVHCLIIEEGAHTLPDGRAVEAHSVLSTATSGRTVGWNNNRLENVTATLVNSYAQMVVLGQVMSFADSRPSTFWTNNCVSRSAGPTPSGFCVGKHIGSINETRADETLGFIVLDAGTGRVNGADYAFALGPRSVAGVGNSPPYNYTLSGDFDTGVATQMAEQGGDGGWAVLYGADPLPANRIGLAVDEETAARDTTRRHITENIFYAVFADPPTATLDLEKSSDIDPAATFPYAVPDSDVIYTLTVTSLGPDQVDADTIFIADSLSSDLGFVAMDFDGSGPG
ncbi:MAG: hypothetical protein AAGD40_05275, partial [Pseudomonadota bacterium]